MSATCTHTYTPHTPPHTLFLSYLFDMAQGLDDSESLKFFLKTSSVNQKILISKAPSHVLGSHEIWGSGNLDLLFVGCPRGQIAFFLECALEQTAQPF